MAVRKTPDCPAQPIGTSTCTAGASTQVAAGGATAEQVVAARFNAKVLLDMTDSVSGERVWAGSLARVHFVTEGAYMHEEPARRAIRDALATIFADFPNQLDKEGSPD